jgi:hypothetical protein
MLKLHKYEGKEDIIYTKYNNLNKLNNMTKEVILKGEE